jgi:hypothetical protein
MFVTARMQKNMDIPKETWEKNKFSIFYRKTSSTKKGYKMGSQHYSEKNIYVLYICKNCAREHKQL